MTWRLMHHNENGYPDLHTKGEWSDSIVEQVVKRLNIPLSDGQKLQIITEFLPDPIRNELEK